VAAGILAVDEHGMDASADQIAAAAGVSRTVLYRYFRDKDDLHQAIAQQLVQVVVASLVPSLRTGSTANEIIRGTVTVVVDWIDRHPNLYEFLQSRGRSAGLNAIEVTMADQVAGLLAAFIRAFGLDDEVAEPGGYALVGLVEVSSRWWLKARPTSREKFVDFLCRAVWHLIDGALRDAGFTLDPDDPLPRDVLEETPITTEER
jgi:AcrR family transcriptional regulator